MIFPLSLPEQGIDLYHLLPWNIRKKAF